MSQLADHDGADRRWFSYENALLSLLFATFGFVFFDRLALPIIFPFIAVELHLDTRHLGALVAGLGLTWALSGWLVGMLSDRWRARKAMLVAAVTIFSLTSALSGMVSSFGQLLAVRLLMGVAEGPVLPLCQSILATSSSSDRRGLNMGLLQASASGLLGALAAPFVLNALAEAWGWRVAFYLSCLPSLMLAGLLAIVVREPSEEAFAPRDPKETRGKAGNGRRNVAICIAISCCFVTWFMNIMTFAPTYLIHDRHFSVSMESVVLTAAGLAYVMWGFVVPGLSDRFGRRPVLVIFAALSAGAPVTFLAAGSPWSMAAAVALTFAGPGCFPLFMATVPAESVDPLRVAGALGLVMGVGEIVGGCAMPYISGLGSMALGPDLPFAIAAIGAIASTLLALFLTETRPRLARLG
ncbi:MFS transporter [Sphingomonas sp. CGMCC 1.13654]|uniref:MFS transporter n=1 Tax=Sphingomonas chungangi TaxID=2683589 RepID=A0A838LA84_9SPHN|nr:MFS transporter [Sphingomonas chungangi]